MLWVLPLEILTERYTEQWHRWFEQGCQKRSIEYSFVEGVPLTSTIENGWVLDTHGTNYWKMTQVAAVCKLFREGRVHSGDSFFTMDMWHPGLEVIPYMAQMDGLDIKVYGFLHAGSYTEGDFAEPMAPWAVQFERGWASICHKIFVGSEYHKWVFWHARVEALPGPSLASPDRIVATGNPYCSAEVLAKAGPLLPANERAKLVVFPNRWDTEKDPMRFIDILNLVWRVRQDFTAIATTSRAMFRSNSQALLEGLSRANFPLKTVAGLTKTQYYETVASARVYVSTAIEETFGMCFVESATLGCTPVLPCKLSYPEMVDRNANFLYRDNEEAAALVSQYLDEPLNAAHYVQRYDHSFDRILDEMGY